MKSMKAMKAMKVKVMKTMKVKHRKANKIREPQTRESFEAARKVITDKMKKVRNKIDPNRHTKPIAEAVRVRGERDLRSLAQQLDELNNPPAAAPAPAAAPVAPAVAAPAEAAAPRFQPID